MLWARRQRSLRSWELTRSLQLEFAHLQKWLAGQTAATCMNHRSVRCCVRCAQRFHLPSAPVLQHLPATLAVWSCQSTHTCLCGRSLQYQISLEHLLGFLVWKSTSQIRGLPSAIGMHQNLGNKLQRACPNSSGQAGLRHSLVAGIRMLRGKACLSNIKGNSLLSSKFLLSCMSDHDHVQQAHI